MDQLIPSLAALVEAFRDCFHPQVFSTFQTLIAGWIVCVGPRTISEVWQATGLAARRHHDTAYAVFHSACWERVDLGIVGTLTIQWYCVKGHEGSHVERERPWYEDRVMPTFTDILGALRLQMWEFK